jgi:hypothetical protein
MAIQDKADFKIGRWHNLREKHRRSGKPTPRKETPGLPEPTDPKAVDAALTESLGTVHVPLTTMGDPPSTPFMKGALPESIPLPPSGPTPATKEKTRAVNTFSQNNQVAIPFPSSTMSAQDRLALHFLDRGAQGLFQNQGLTAKFEQDYSRSPTPTPGGSPMKDVTYGSNKAFKDNNLGAKFKEQAKPIERGIGGAGIEASEWSQTQWHLPKRTHPVDRSVEKEMLLRLNSMKLQKEAETKKSALQGYTNSQASSGSRSFSAGHITTSKSQRFESQNENDSTFVDPQQHGISSANNPSRVQFQLPQTPVKKSKEQDMASGFESGRKYPDTPKPKPKDPQEGIQW